MLPSSIWDFFTFALVMGYARLAARRSGFLGAYKKNKKTLVTKLFFLGHMYFLLSAKMLTSVG